MSRDDEARTLVALYDERCRMASAMARAEHPDGAMAEGVLAKGVELDTACEAFRRKHYPRRAEVFVGLWAVVVASPSRRRVMTVLDLFDEYRQAAAS